MNFSTISIHLQITRLQGEIQDTLTGSCGNQKKTANFADILGIKHAGLAENGHNLALFDPEAAYSMMTRINQFEALFKGQFAELSALGEGVADMEAAGCALGELDANSSEDEIVAQMQEFVADYNAWEDRFDDSVAQGGVLDHVQAAEISRYELEQSVQNIFFGAAEGFSGLGDLGISIDPQSKQATFDGAKFESAVDSNKTGVVNTLDEFSANFTRSAELLNEKDNFIPRQLANQHRAIDYISGNRTSLENEFGRGDAAQLTDTILQALTAYTTARGIS